MRAYDWTNEQQEIFKDIQSVFKSDNTDDSSFLLASEHLYKLSYMNPTLAPQLLGAVNDVLKSDKLKAESLRYINLTFNCMFGNNDIDNQGLMPSVHDTIRKSLQSDKNDGTSLAAMYTLLGRQCGTYNHNPEICFDLVKTGMQSSKNTPSSIECACEALDCISTNSHCSTQLLAKIRMMKHLALKKGLTADIKEGMAKTKESGYKHISRTPSLNKGGREE